MSRISDTERAGPDARDDPRADRSERATADGDHPQTEPTLRDRVAPHRDPAYEVDPLFVNRWSPRSMTGEALEESEFMPLFEAARWAPSSRNEQPWQFLYATREGEAWETFLALPYEKNRQWAQDAAVLVVVCAKRTFDYDGSHNGTHAFDTGAAWENLALEGTRRGLAVHAMAGFDHEAAREALSIPEDYAVKAMVAVGVHDPEAAPESEHPNGRRPLAAVVTEGGFD